MAMQKILKVLGKRGRITIPQEIRRSLDFRPNDVVSFEQDGDAVTVRLEKLCDDCKTAPAPEPEQPGKTAAALTELLDGLAADELRAALIQLSVRLAEMQSGGDGTA
jgi:AbrB family looped-hinge helix DNA binding protein